MRTTWNNWSLFRIWLRKDFAIIEFEVSHLGLTNTLRTEHYRGEQSKKNPPERVTRKRGKERAVTAPWGRGGLQVKKAVASRSHLAFTGDTTPKASKRPSSMEEYTRFIRAFRSILWRVIWNREKGRTSRPEKKEHQEGHLENEMQLTWSPDNETRHPMLVWGATGGSCPGRSWKDLRFPSEPAMLPTPASNWEMEMRPWIIPGLFNENCANHGYLKTRKLLCYLTFSMLFGIIYTILCVCVCVFLKGFSIKAQSVFVKLKGKRLLAIFGFQGDNSRYKLFWKHDKYYSLFLWLRLFIKHRKWTYFLCHSSLSCFRFPTYSSSLGILVTPSFLP